MKVILSALVMTTMIATTATAELGVADFEKLHRELQPSEDAAWRTIPWKTSMLDAQAAAAKQKKPIFIWAMDGHPLGCT
jgi:hypothetical protein